MEENVVVVEGPVAVVTFVTNMIVDILAVFMTPPALWFVGIALVTASASVAKKFVPMRKR